MKTISDTRPLEAYPIETGAAITHGDIVALNVSGNAVPASDASGLEVKGVAISILASGHVILADGIIAFENGATSEAFTRADRGKPAYAIGAQKVGKLGGSNKVVAGIVTDVHETFVYVDIRPAAIKAAKSIESFTDTNTTYSAATSSVLGLVKQGVAVPNAAETAPTKAEFDALLASLRTAGVIAAGE